MCKDSDDGVLFLRISPYVRSNAILNFFRDKQVNVREAVRDSHSRLYILLSRVEDFVVDDLKNVRLGRIFFGYQLSESII